MKVSGNIFWHLKSYRRWPRIELLMVKLFYANSGMKVDVTLNLAAHFDCRFRLQNKFTGRDE